MAYEHPGILIMKELLVLFDEELGTKSANEVDLAAIRPDLLIWAWAKLSAWLLDNQTEGVLRFTKENGTRDAIKKPAQILRKGGRAGRKWLALQKELNPFDFGKSDDEKQWQALQSLAASAATKEYKAGSGSANLAAAVAAEISDAARIYYRRAYARAYSMGKYAESALNLLASEVATHAVRAVDYAGKAAGYDDLKGLDLNLAKKAYGRQYEKFMALLEKAARKSQKQK